MCKPKLQLVGREGNVFSILARARKKITEWNRKHPDNLIDIDEFQREAIKGDYDHVIQVCMKYFEVS